MAEELISLSHSAEADGEDESNAIFFGVVRDCAYRIRNRAAQELETRSSADDRQASQNG